MSDIKVDEDELASITITGLAVSDHGFTVGDYVFELRDLLALPADTVLRDREGHHYRISVDCPGARDGRRVYLDSKRWPHVRLDLPVLVTKLP